MKVHLGAMMKVHIVVGISAMCASIGIGGLFAGTVTINPGNGVATNVTQRITGETDVVVNSGATGGGIVTLNPYNAYTGTTTLNSGTLIATALGGDVGSSIGLAGDLVLGAGTFRYAGADGATVSQAISSTVSSTTATVFDTPNDLTLSGGYTQTDGAFIKTGAGTLTVAAGDNRFDASTLTSPGKTSIAEADTVVPLTLNTLLSPAFSVVAFTVPPVTVVAVTPALLMTVSPTFSLPPLVRSTSLFSFTS